MATRLETATPGHDEFWKFLGPYGWSRGYMGEDGKPAKAGLIPTLDESIENKTILLGSPEQVAEGIQFYRELLSHQLFSEKKCALTATWQHPIIKSSR